MDNQNLDKLKSLLESGESEEAGNALQQMLQTEMPAKERGEILVEIASLYSKLQRQSLGGYNEQLKLVTETLQDLTSEEQGLDDIAGIQSARDTLQKP
jgi:hypothetical protein